MPRPKQSPEQIAAMRERILQAAREILFDEGPEALSVRAIASRLGVSHMTLYTYFGSQGDIVVALKERQRAWIQARHQEFLDRAAGGDVCAVMRESLDSYVRLAQTRPRIYRFLWVMPRSDAELCEERPHRLAIHLQHLASLVRLGIERGVFAERDPLVAAATAFSIVNGPLFMQHAGHLVDQDLRDRLITESLDAAMGYLRERPVVRTATEKDTECETCDV